MYTKWYHLHTCLRNYTWKPAESIIGPRMDYCGTPIYLCLHVMKWPVLHAPFDIFHLAIYHSSAFPTKPNSTWFKKKKKLVGAHGQSYWIPCWKPVWCHACEWRVLLKKTIVLHLCFITTFEDWSDIWRLEWHLPFQWDLSSFKT